MQIYAVQYPVKPSISKIISFAFMSEFLRNNCHSVFCCCFSSIRGSIQEDSTLLLGPSEEGNFKKVQFQSIHRNRSKCRVVMPGQAATLALGEWEEFPLRKVRILWSPLFMLFVLCKSQSHCGASDLKPCWRSRFFLFFATKCKFVYQWLGFDEKEFVLWNFIVNNYS